MDTNSNPGIGSEPPSTTEELSRSENGPPISFSPCFDLIIELDTNRDSGLHTFYVYSAALKAASPVWRKMLSPDEAFAPLQRRDLGNGRSLEVLHIDDVGSEAATIFLDVLHHRLIEVPNSVTFDQLSDIAKLADEFDSAAPFLLWVALWVKALDEEGTHKHNSAWFPICKIFRDVERCREIHQYITRLAILYSVNIEADPEALRLEGVPGIVDPVYLQTSFIADDLLRHIRKERAEILLRTVTRVMEFTSRLATHPDTLKDAPPWCPSTACQELAAGSLFCSLSPKRLTMLLGCEAVLPESISIAVCRDAIESLRLSTLKSTVTMNAYGTLTGFSAVGHTSATYLGMIRAVIHRDTGNNRWINAEYSVCPLIYKLDSMKADVLRIVNDVAEYRLSGVRASA